jgi:two-component system, OmpR family, response regulator
MVGMVGRLSEAVVLAVDDDAEVRELLRLVLTRHVREVVVADSVESAMALMKSVHPTLIISDICMPDYDGYDLIRRVRASEATRATPAVALSAYSLDASRDAALAAGFDMFVRKPLDVTYFVAVLAALLG